ncbi:SUMO ligase siz1 [Onygenales sp. PD_12]|nr:SUMO ligase siz1 [Onygenales sp. PD_12]
MASSSVDLHRAVVVVKTLINNQLKDVLRSENLPVSGVKAVLQARIIDRLEQLFHAGQSARFEQLRRFIYVVAQQPMPPRTPTQASPPYQQQPHSAMQPYPHQSQQPAFSTTMAPSQPLSSGRLNFKESPFYTVIEPLTPVVECKVRESTRDSASLKVILRAETALRLQTDPSLRVMVYCAADNGLTHYTKCDIAFPHQVELKANLDDVKANLRGLKNKPGSTRPADITNFIRKKADYVNHVVMTYALTQKKFYVVVNLVQKHSVEDLVKQLQTRKTISAEQVIREMKNRAEDTDIIATSTVMSLKCPLSTLRISVPCRTTLCTHNQCFDATSFLQLQEQGPTWTCPVCNKATNFDALQIDQYVDNILRATPSSVDQVTIEPDGVWSKPADADDARNGTGQPPSDDEDDNDLIEIQDDRLVTMKQEPMTTSMTLQSTPSARSRELSSVPSASRQSTNKRPASQVIDLTLSDDDEEPPRPAKRPYIPPYPPSRYSDFPSRGSLSNTSFGISSPSGSNSPGANSYLYDA